MISQMTYYTLIYPRRKRKTIAAAPAVSSRLGFTERDPLLVNRVDDSTSGGQQILNRFGEYDDNAGSNSGGNLDELSAETGSQRKFHIE
jgi:hypothetical protein